MSKILERLLEFNEDQWVNFIQQLCYDLQPDPSLVSISPDRISQLFWIYNQLSEINKEQRGKYLSSLLQFLRNIDPQPQNSHLIYDLIYVLHETRPVGHRQLIESIVRDESFIQLSWGSDNLHYLLIKAYIYLENPTRLFLREYIHTSVNVTIPYSLYVAVSYYASLNHPEEALKVLCHCLMDPVWWGSEEASSEIYHCLVDHIPNPIPLITFTRFIWNRSIGVGNAGDILNSSIDRFLDRLRFCGVPIALVLETKSYLKRFVETDEYGTKTIRPPQDNDLFAGDLEHTSLSELIDVSMDRVDVEQNVIQAELMV